MRDHVRGSGVVMLTEWPDKRVNGSKTQVAGWSTYTFLLWTIKGAVCTSYLRLTVCLCSVMRPKDWK